MPTFAATLMQPKLCKRDIGDLRNQNLGLLFPEQEADKINHIGQTYDGESVMRGLTGGISKKVQDIYLNAKSIW